METFTIKTNDGCWDNRFVRTMNSCTFEKAEAIRFSDWNDADRAAGIFAREHHVRAWAEEMTD